MISVPSLWTKHRRLAYGIASEYGIPGMDRDDVNQEALVALWEACRSFDREKGPFPPYAKRVIRARIIDLLRAATTEKRTAETVEWPDVAAPDETEGHQQLQLMLEALPSLTDRERKAVGDHLNGATSKVTKRHDNALTCARRKLRAAVA